MAEYRPISVHQALGGGPGSPYILCFRLIESIFMYATCTKQSCGFMPFADVLLWRRWRGGAVVLVASTAMWSLFGFAGYNLLSFASHVLLLLVCILFFWAKSASLLNRPLPPLPDLEISEELVLGAADVMRVWINRLSSVAHDIAVGRNLKLFVQIAVSLWIISYIGGFFNFITMVYIGILLSLSVPVLYEKYQDRVDEKLILAHKIIQTQYRKLDDIVLGKIPMPLNKEKKSK